MKLMIGYAIHATTEETSSTTPVPKPNYYHYYTKFKPAALNPTLSKTEW